MSETFTEQLVKRKDPGWVPLIKILLIVLTAVAIISSFLWMPILGIAGFLLIGLDIWLFRNWDIEYEYIYVNGELDVDKIMGRARRKRIFSFDINNMEIIAPYKSHELDYYKKGQGKLVDLSSRDPHANVYMMVIHADKEMLKVILEPEAAIINGMRNIAPRKVKMY